MTGERTDIRIRRWLHGHPGFFQSEESEHAVLEMARQASGVVCPVEEFTAALARCGYRVRQMQRGEATVWQLALPERVGGDPRHIPDTHVAGLVRDHLDSQG